MAYSAAGAARETKRRIMTAASFLEARVDAWGWDGRGVPQCPEPVDAPDVLDTTGGDPATTSSRRPDDAVSIPRIVLEPDDSRGSEIIARAQAPGRLRSPGRLAPVLPSARTAPDSALDSVVWRRESRRRWSRCIWSSRERVADPTPRTLPKRWFDLVDLRREHAEGFRQSDSADVVRKDRHPRGTLRATVTPKGRRQRCGSDRPPGSPWAPEERRPTLVTALAAPIDQRAWPGAEPRDSLMTFRVMDTIAVGRTGSTRRTGSAFPVSSGRGPAPRKPASHRVRAAAFSSRAAARWRDHHGAEGLWATCSGCFR